MFILQEVRRLGESQAFSPRGALVPSADERRFRAYGAPRDSKALKYKTKGI